ncbi:protein Njmu-R1 [Bombina bombina]|uniref:protein Njmu-R1 n=1 Tax=Bombina bombina TaxID=8345 RepID=UPI00235A556F|nr:protein Njmu-R1 [Bombina bombina]
MNQNEANLHFTYEWSRTSLTYLDLNIEVKEGAIETSTYFKKVDSNNYVHQTSCHHKNWKNNIPKGQFLRMKKNCLDPQKWEEQAQTIKTKFLERGYKEELLDQKIEEIRDIERKELTKYKNKVDRIGDNQAINVPLITEYSENSKIIEDIFRRHWNILMDDEILGEKLPRKPKFVYRRTKNLKSKLAPSIQKKKPSEVKDTFGKTEHCVPGTLFFRSYFLGSLSDRALFVYLSLEPRWLLLQLLWEMLQTQTSLAESVDGDELRSDDGFPEERKGERQSCSFYSFYVYQPGSLSHNAADSDDGCPSSAFGEAPSTENFSLSLVDTDLPAEAEPELRSFIAKRLSRGALFEGMGNVASVELSFPDYCMGCYYCLLQDKTHEATNSESNVRPPEYIVCFLGGSEKGLDLFRLELDKYIENLKSKLDPQMDNLDSCITPYLRSWFEDSVLPVYRVVHLFQDKLAYLLHAALTYTPVEVKNSDNRTQNDINRFLSSASLQGLVQEGTMTSLCIAMTEESNRFITVDCSDAQPHVTNAGSNKFCDDWMQTFISSYDGGNPFLFRQKLDNFKLKAIQDLNILKRLIRQAEMSHYALYKCYMFLKNCGNGDVLLQIVKVEHAEMPEASSVVQVLEEFINEVGFSLHSS